MWLSSIQMSVLDEFFISEILKWKRQSGSRGTCPQRQWRTLTLGRSTSSPVLATGAWGTEPAVLGSTETGKSPSSRGLDRSVFPQSSFSYLLVLDRTFGDRVHDYSYIHIFIFLYCLKSLARIHVCLGDVFWFWVSTQLIEGEAVAQPLACCSQNILLFLFHFGAFFALEKSPWKREGTERRWTVKFHSLT